MSRLMPQELEVWYLIPSLRKELAKIFIEDNHMTQKDAAKLLGITESAVSQYVKAKRAKSIKFSKNELEEIKGYADKIVADKVNARKHFYELSLALRGSAGMCALHKKQDYSVAENCAMCKNHRLVQ